MMKPTLAGWLLLIFGDLIFLALMLAQLLMIIRPDSQKTRDILIGKGKQWRDHTHFKSAKAFAVADWLLLMPLLILANVGVFIGRSWGYVILLILGVLTVYFSIVFWVMEREYTYPSVGAIGYFTYYWGFYLYWGIWVAVYSILKLEILF